MTHPSPEAVAKAMDYAVVVARDMKRRAARGTHPDMPSETCIDTLAAHVAALTAQLEAERAARTCNGNLQVQDATAFLEEASRYFENRPTHGEDRAHWSNVHNAENCRKVISTLTRETARADKAEAEAKALREALEDGYKMLAQAFNRIHALPRSSDTALAEQIGQTRARIETALARATLAQPAAKETT